MQQGSKFLLRLCCDVSQPGGHGWVVQVGAQELGLNSLRLCLGSAEEFLVGCVEDAGYSWSGLLMSLSLQSSS